MPKLFFNNDAFFQGLLQFVVPFDVSMSSNEPVLPSGKHLEGIIKIGIIEGDSTPNSTKRLGIDSLALP